MKWPEFSGDVCVAASEQMFHLVLLEKFVKPLNKAGLVIEIITIEKDDLSPKGGFLYSPAWYHFFISKAFIENQYTLQTDLFSLFKDKLSEVLGMSANIYDGTGQETVRSAMFTFYTLDEKHNIFLFQLHNQTIEVLNARSTTIFQARFNLLESNNEIYNDEIRKAYSLEDQVYYLDFRDERWAVIDPLDIVAQRINSEYRKNTDSRVNKPDIILHQDNLNKKYTFGDSWVLNFDGLSTMMTRPNDVSIYASICEKNLKDAISFYDKTILPRHEYHHGPFPTIEQQTEYYDYFELITTALIFAFTAIEAFTNSIIPDDYEYITTEGTIHNKTRIERSYPLTKKLIRVLKDILNTPDPKQEDWWANLELLQDLRDETIHTKQSYSAERYSKLLQKDIFSLIQVHKTVINFYGHYIYLNASGLLNVYPYEFGYDQISPSLMTDETYRKIYNDLHNPHNPL